MTPAVPIHDHPGLRGQVGVFLDRADAGARLAPLLEDLAGSDALVLAIPAGGVPVAVPLAERLGLELDVAVVSKVTLPWNTEVGCGAVAFDGTARWNDGLIAQVGLGAEDLAAAEARTRAKVERRVRELRGDRPFPELAGRTVVLVDDGLASGFTMRVAVEAVRRLGPRELRVAVPTAHEESLGHLGPADAVACANVRGGFRFAVASAYRRWTDVSEEEVRALLARTAAFPPTAAA